MTLTRPEAAHLLRRAAVGGDTSQIDSFVGLSRQEAVDRLFGAPSAGLPTFAAFASADGNWRAQENMIEWWVDRMITSAPNVEERLTLFLHGHFTSAREKVRESDLMWEQHVVLRNHGQGSFRNLIGRISFGSAMLIYLDNETNVKGAEQENFARELMELYTIGPENFTEADVVAMAKAWTGHNTVGATRENNFVYDPTYVFKSGEHDNSNKTLFGITKNWDANDTLDELCTGVQGRNMAEFFTRKMFEFYVHTNPPPAVINELASGFQASNLNIGQLLRSILMHDEFWSEEARYALVKSPVEFMVDIMRRCGMRSDDLAVRWRMEGMGMTLFDPPTVAGWGHNDFWLSTASAWAKTHWSINLKWGARDRGILQDLEGLTPAQATTRVLTFFSIFDASQATRNAIEELIAKTQEERPWALRSEPFAVGMFVPEVQCA